VEIITNGESEEIWKKWMKSPDSRFTSDNKIFKKLASSRTSTVKMEAPCPTKMAVNFYQTMWLHIPQDLNKLLPGWPLIKCPEFPDILHTCSIPHYIVTYNLNV
jgi:hypothetical protein